MLTALASLGLMLQAGEWGLVGQDARLFATAPARWEARDWGLAAAAVGVTAALVPLVDRPSLAWMREHQDPGVSRAADVVRQAGNGWYTVPMLGALWGSGMLMESPRETRAAREAVEALLFTTVVSQAAKYSTGRRPPFATDDPWDWNASRGADGNSFGSGHAHFLQRHQRLSRSEILALPPRARLDASPVRLPDAAEMGLRSCCQDTRRRRGRSHALDAARRGGKAVARTR